MEIAPASLAQIVKGRDGRYIEIEDDVQSVAGELRELDPSLHLRYSESGRYFVVYQKLEDGSEQLVTTAKQLDKRLVKKVRRLVHASYDLAEELERGDAEADREAERRFSEDLGPAAERLRHAVRKDIGSKRRVFLS